MRQINFFNENKQYELLHVLQFQSLRRCMSVILKCLKSQQVIVFCKGAESAIFQKCIRGNIQQANANINEFANLGWRTLAFAYKTMSIGEYENYDRMLAYAYNDITNRDANLTRVFNEIETGFTLLGVTGVEDRLQDECSITLEALRKSGIKIWVLTGDKKETAVNISYSSRHFSKDLIELQITDLKSANEIEYRLAMVSQRYFWNCSHEKFRQNFFNTSVLAFLHKILKNSTKSD
jgi:magnesium-transporting ATPase (P-type)